MAWLKDVDAHYPEEWKIRIILDNHSAHISKETKVYLATVPNRFEFIFTPKHGSWLNLIEVFFSKRKFRDRERQFVSPQQGFRSISKYGVLATV